MACGPRPADVTAIPLLRRLPGASSNLPERLARTDPRLASQRRSYSVLLPVGFAVPFPSLETRCALTAPFHPYRGQNTTQPRRSVLCGTVPEVYPRESGDPPRRTLSGTVRPWSPDFPPRPPFGIGAERPSGRLTEKTWRGKVAASRRWQQLAVIGKKLPGPVGGRGTGPGSGESGWVQPAFRLKITHRRRNAAGAHGWAAEMPPAA